MGQRVIPVAVTAEYIGGDGVTLGAAGSHNSVLIEYDFRSAGPQWEGVSGRYVLWTNPQGNNTNRINLGVSEKVAGYEGVYQAAPPADAMCVPGWAEMVVVGFTMDGDKEVTKIKTEPSRFRVLPGSSRAADNEGIAPTVADQLQAEIEAVETRKVNKPVSPYDADGKTGQILESLGGGQTRWRDENVATKAVVDEVLSSHPDWVTTVQNGAVSYPKLADDVKELGDLFYDFQVKRFRRYHTDCYVVRVPLNDEDGNQIDPYIAFDEVDTPTEYARKNHTTLTINGNSSLRIKNSDPPSSVVGNCLSRGELIFHNDLASSVEFNANGAKYISINADRSITEHSVYMTADELQAAGAYTLFTIYYKLVANGAATDLTNLTDDDGKLVSSREVPGNVIGITSDKTLIFLQNDGRVPESYGLSAVQMQEIMLEEGAVNAWYLDGGRSQSMTYKGTKVGRNIDDYGTVERMIRFKLNFKRDRSPYSKSIADIYEKIGEEKQNTVAQVMGAVNKIRIADSTSENILDIAKRMYQGRILLVYSGDDHADWLPAPGADYKWAMFEVINFGTQILVTATRYDGKRKARITYHDGAWENWEFEPTIIQGETDDLAIPSGETSVVSINVANPESRPVSVSALPLNTSWAIATLGSIGTNAVQFSVRNLNTSQSITCRLRYSITLG